MQPKDTSVQTDAIDLSAIFGLLRRQFRIISMAVAVIIGVATIYLFSVTPKFTATALVSIEYGRDVLSDQTQTSSNTASISAQVEGVVQILRSSDTLLALINEANLFADPEFGVRLSKTERVRAWLGLETNQNVSDVNSAVVNVLNRFADAVDIRRRGLTYLIEVAVTSEDPEKAARLANQLVKIYIARQVDGKVVQLLAAREILNSRIESAQQELQDFQQQSDTFLDRVVNQFVDSGIDPQLSALRDQLLSANGQLAATKQKSAALTAVLEGREIGTANEELLSSAMRELVAQRAALTKELTAANEAQGIDADTLREQLDALEIQLIVMAEEDRNASVNIINDTTKIADQARADLRDAALKADLPADDLSAFYQLQQETATARVEYENLLRRVRQVETLADVQISDATLASSAVIPSQQSFPNPRLILALALVAGTGLGIGLAFVNEYLVGGVTSEDQLSILLNSPVALSLPAISVGNSEDVAQQVITAPMSGFTESLRQVRRQALRMQRDGDGGRITLFTSSLPEEGKTTAAVAFARTLALSGQRTLLVDLDLRKPSVAARMGLPSSAVLMKVLSGTLNMSALQAATSLEETTGLHVITGGGRSNLPTDTLASSHRMEALVAQWRTHYEAIVFDTAPLLPVVDTLYLAHHADIIGMMVRFAATNQLDIKRAAERLWVDLGDGVPILPILSMEQRARRAYYYGGYYSGYTKGS